MKIHFENFDLKTFWDTEEEMPKKLTDKMVEKAEKRLGYKLPRSYIELLKTRNGGFPVNACFPTQTATSWAEDHIAIETICGIGVEDGIDDEYGSQYLIKEWGYPEIGIWICNCPSAGHDAVFLDYRECGKDGEPQIVHIDQENDYKITFLSKDFETFINGLVSEDDFEEKENGIEPEIISAIYSNDLLKNLEEFKKKNNY
ncbi:MAG: SMI1/KNR4 family protein [Prevotellaceae bacterium]|jgi:hypothetical protein|nr:SMI1/KNR4 family protein [Prevotellaceae bacterium]